MYVSYVLINDIHIQTYSVIVVIVHECLCFDEHVRYIKSTAICAQRMYLIKRLCDQGLAVKQVNIVFESLVVVNRSDMAFPPGEVLYYR